jgi:hypothetical protein
MGPRLAWDRWATPHARNSMHWRTLSPNWLEKATMNQSFGYGRDPAIETLVKYRQREDVQAKDIATRRTKGPTRFLSPFDRDNSQPETELRNRNRRSCSLRV